MAHDQHKMFIINQTSREDIADVANSMLSFLEHKHPSGNTYVSCDDSLLTDEICQKFATRLGEIDIANDSPEFIARQQDEAARALLSDIGFVDPADINNSERPANKILSEIVQLRKELDEKQDLYERLVSEEENQRNNSDVGNNNDVANNDDMLNHQKKLIEFYRDELEKASRKIDKLENKRLSNTDHS